MTKYSGTGIGVSVDQNFWDFADTLKYRLVMICPFIG